MHPPGSGYWLHSWRESNSCGTSEIFSSATEQKLLTGTSPSNSAFNFDCVGLSPVHSKPFWRTQRCQSVWEEGDDYALWVLAIGSWTLGFLHQGDRSPDFVYNGLSVSGILPRRSLNWAQFINPFSTRYGSSILEFFLNKGLTLGGDVSKTAALQAVLVHLFHGGR